MSAPISLEEALALVAGQAVGQAGSERVPLLGSLGRRLAVDQAMPGPWPSTDRAAMDGFALRAAAGAAAGTRLTVIGECLAGHPFDGVVAPGQAVRIMTGAVVPDSVDAVVPVEDTSGYDGAEVELGSAVVPGANIRRQGSEVAAGSVVLAAGTRIRAAEVGVLAVLGCDPVPVFGQPRVAIVATGDEVVALDRQPLPHQVRDSNSYALAALVAECGGVARRLGVAPDAAAVLRQLLQQALAEADVVLTIGGVSKGTHDLVHGTLRDLGVERVFHGVALKPGKPTFFGRLDGGKRPRFVFGLPGNPASCFAVFELLVRPLLQRLGGVRGAGSDLQAKLTGTPFKRNRRSQAIPGSLGAAAGELVASLQAFQPSGDPFALASADGLALIPGDRVPEDTPWAEFVRYSGGDRSP